VAFFPYQSAGAHLAALSVIHLLTTHPTFPHLSGVAFNFGVFDLSLLPQATHFKVPLVLDIHHMKAFIDAFLPGRTGLERRDPSISPLYVDLAKFRGRLPPAIFTVRPNPSVISKHLVVDNHSGSVMLTSILSTTKCGTQDMLLDDTVFMSCKWQMAGGRVVTKVYPGASHGFILFEGKCQKDAFADIKAFLNHCMGS
jgi:acetyl esterase/lipase